MGVKWVVPWDVMWVDSMDASTVVKTAVYLAGNWVVC